MEKIKFPKEDYSNKINAFHHEKMENGRFPTIIKAVAVGKEGLKTFADVRISLSDGGIAYACVWLNGKKISCAGSAKAGGWGYDKYSSAVFAAVRNAGIVCPSFAGMGCEAMEKAILAIAKKLSGKRKVYLVEAFL